MKNKNGTASTDAKLRDQELIYQLEGRPRFRTAFPLGMQHVLCMFTSNLAPLLIVAAACVVGLMLVRYYHYAYLRYKYSLENFMRLDDDNAKKKAEEAAAK